MSTPPVPATTTVVVSRSVVPGAEAEAQQWLHRLIRRARFAPGYQRSDVQPPGPQHPGEWVVVYEFDTATNLEAWLCSPERQDLIDDEKGLFTSTRQQQVARSPQATSVTAIASFRLQGGADAAFREHFRKLAVELRSFDGFLRVEHIPPVPGVQEETAIIFSFESRPELDAWLNSDRRAELLGQVEPLLTTGRTVNVVGGFAGWFAPADERPSKTWKQATLVLVALYPTSLILGMLRGWLLPDLPSPLGVLIGNIAGVGVLAWILMPRLTSRFSAWLRV